MSIQQNKQNQSNRFLKNLLLSEEDGQAYIIAQTKYLMNCFKRKGYISKKDLLESYKILEQFQKKQYKNKIREYTSKPKIIDNIEQIIMLRKEGYSHQQLANAFPISKATIQKYLKLLEIE